MKKINWHSKQKLSKTLKDIIKICRNYYKYKDALEAKIVCEITIIDRLLVSSDK